MNLIDEEGRLFGVINIIDALVVLLVLAVILGGVMLSLQPKSSPSSSPELDTTYATLDIGTQPLYIVDQINEGDQYSSTESTNLSITDIHITSQERKPAVLVRVRLEGPEGQEGTLDYDGAPPRLGRELSIQTSKYQVSGQIIAVGNGDELATKDTNILLRTTLPSEDAAALSSGEELRVSGRTIGTLNEVIQYPTDQSGQQVIYLSATLTTVVTNDDLQFGRRVLRRGTTINLPTSVGRVQADVIGFGESIDTRLIDVLVTTTLDADTATTIDEGDTYLTDDRAVATVESVTVYGTSDPGSKRAFVGLSLSTISPSDRPLFGTRVVETGSELRFRTDEYAFTGDIRRVGATGQRGTPAVRTVKLQIHDVSPQFAQSIEEGMTETTSGETVARVTDILSEDSTVVLTSQDGQIYERKHPLNKDLTISADLMVYETSTGTTFKGQTIQQGSTILLDLGRVTIEATVTSL